MQPECRVEMAASAGGLRYGSRESRRKSSIEREEGADSRTLERISEAFTKMSAE